MFKNKVVAGSISKHGLVLILALSISPSKNFSVHTWRRLAYLLQVSFTYQSPHAGRRVGGNADFPHSGSCYKPLQKLTVDPLLDKDPAGAEADFTLPGTTQEDKDRAGGRAPLWVGHTAL